MTTIGPRVILDRLEYMFDVEKREHDSTRGGTASHPVVPGARPPVLLVEDTRTGLLSWVFGTMTRSGDCQYVLPERSADRGANGVQASNVLRFLVPRRSLDAALEHAGNLFAKRWEAQHRPECLRRYDAEAANRAAGDAPPDANRLADGDTTLVLIHGLAATTASGFNDLRGIGLSRLSGRYEGRILGYDHPTLATAPDENALSLLGQLTELRAKLGGRLRLDVIGHGRGGLVARGLAELCAAEDVPISIDRIWCVGTPNLGSRLCEPAHLGSLLDRMTNLVSWLPVGDFDDQVDGIFAIVHHVMLGMAEGLDGLTAMSDQSAWLLALNERATPASTRLYGVTSSFEAGSGSTFGQRARALVADGLLRGRHDLIVECDSVTGPIDKPVIPLTRQLVLGATESVFHGPYFSHPATIDFIVCNRGAQRGSRDMRLAPGGSWRPALHEPDGTIIDITVTHGSLEEAEYAVMVGTYEDETLTGAERFLDRQLTGLLTASFEAGSYPGPLGGSSLFIRPHPEFDRRTSPPGAYVVGLGRSVELNRSRVRHAVGRALVDRCLQLETEPCDEIGQVREVGVTSTLLGVRNADGLSVGESVAGIVEGVLDANRALVRYEGARESSGNPVSSPVRVAELELIERFGDRADLTAMTVRGLPNTIRLRPEYTAALANTAVRRKRGGLPAGSAFVDSPQDWRRFSITSVSHSRPDAAVDQATLTFDVSFLGGDARADRITHQLDRVVIDALSDRLSTQTADEVSAATLYDLLVPEQMRHRFQTVSSVQLIVDETSANYPWELLSALRPSGRAALANQGSVIRQFSETSTRRLVFERARRGSALVIGAGNVAGQASLPGVHRETDRVRDLLSGRFADRDVEYLHDKDAELTTVELINSLDGDHQIIHVASHGEFTEGNPSSTGALLNARFRLRVETVRQLRYVPDLVFLNCCSLGRVGSPRLAAGLAREFMAIGTRAVVAAGWPVSDDAAETFAATFYRQFLDGAVFADAVAAARNASLRSGGRETWAAYQCYGDPLLVLDGDTTRSAVNETDPVSVEDLLRRLESLEVRASDLGRPGSSGLTHRRTQLVQSFDRLEGWSKRLDLLNPGASSDEEARATTAVQRRLASVAAELGDFRAAADRYLAIIQPPVKGGGGKSGLGRRWSNVEDLQQASNCLSRAAQQEARNEHDEERKEVLIKELEDAVELARRAVRLTEESESYGILGGAYKRLATVMPTGRRDRIGRAARAYERRSTSADPKIDPDDDVPYTRLTAAQLALVLDPSTPEPNTDETEATTTSPGRIDCRARRNLTYWEAVYPADQLLTRLLARRSDDNPATILARMIAAYERAFESRSTWRERASSLDHLGDLRDLLLDDDERRHLVIEAIDALRRWEFDNIETPPAHDALDAPLPAARQRVEAAVKLTAIPAGQGDCLVLEYIDTAGGQHRLLVDGGDDSAFEEGLGAFARTQPEGHLTVDVVVVTHIDNDHVTGVTRGIHEELIRPLDVWFNGHDELEQLDIRGTKQGDQLSTVLPGRLRNRVVSGRPLVIPDDGGLPIFDLPGGARCTLLTPNHERLERLRELWRRVPSNRDGPLHESLEDLAQRLDESERGVAGRGFGRDSSVANGSSISFLFEYQQRTILLTGDAFASDVAASISRLLTHRRIARLPLDLFKLSHHGSINNITPELLELLDPERILVCTDGTGRHPDDETISLLAGMPGSPKVYFVGRGERTLSAAEVLPNSVLPISVEPIPLNL